MNGESTAEIRFFDLTTRIGRMRYLAYSLGLSLLGAAAVMVGLICFRIFAPLGILALGAIYIAAIVFSIGLSVRRLHDMDASGWWTLLMLVPLANLILILFLLFKPGTQGDNRFGPMPPPNSTWVLVGAWCYILVYPFAIIGILAAIAIPAYQDYIARSQMSEGIQLAGQAEVPVSQFYQKNKIWPTDISSLYSGRPNDAVGRYVATISVSSSQDGAWGVIATMKEQGVNRMISGKAVELWTNDGGQTWRCGPASANPVDAKYLPVSCRDTEPSPP